MLSVDSVCQEHEVMRDADANGISGKLGSALGGTLRGGPVKNTMVRSID